MSDALPGTESWTRRVQPLEMHCRVARLSCRVGNLCQTAAPLAGDVGAQPRLERAPPGTQTPHLDAELVKCFIGLGVAVRELPGQRGQLFRRVLRVFDQRQRDEADAAVNGISQRFFFELSRLHFILTGACGSAAQRSPTDETIGVRVGRVKASGADWRNGARQMIIFPRCDDTPP